MSDLNPMDQPQLLQQPVDPDAHQATGMEQFQNSYSNGTPILPPELYSLLFKNTITKQNGSQPNEFTARGSWTQQEDEQLIAAVQQLGPKKWIDIAKFVPTRTSKQCRERWHHRLDPSIKHEPFEPWEDRLIIEKQREIGNRWAVIAHQLPGRSASAIKNRWYSGLKSQHPTHAQMDLSLSMQPPSEQGSMLDGVDGSVGSLNGGSADL
ncbi:Myb-like DNA-binding domain containing protein [Trichomonas vaginalis G3]|uniref:Myb-like DNA-binding domain containing protein n=1 Tax=Trichomonas vaginalis (strain ATCC PRA-98 / G3) TaxID=412133 RepID=A2E2C4_TRIV3|nr:RNA polymerase II transcription regulator recruiting protein [Trichomonas vaginalis G3]EAY13224.1 Myb-like DNA-binding domain containing protein [Trichomonas vaginalis G3]KAI5488144.1 RNA polymerase II transcription regulator recruiting protein [Trichomonas vaginalis G3]|eukprot:XP_001325447.1 Myb-like DNA-binding domain containing protein [Trichomonas vaginalis G3]